jgi:serine/threonine protein phosphatase PrpC
MEDAFIIKDNLSYNNKNLFISGIFDGHGGTSVSEWLSNNLHLYIVNQKSFPENPKAAILEAFKEAEEYILANLLTGTLAKTQTSQRKSQVSNKVPAKRKHDCSGSCALVMLIIEKECYKLK